MSFDEIWEMTPWEFQMFERSHSRRRKRELQEAASRVLTIVDGFRSKRFSGRKAWKALTGERSPHLEDLNTTQKWILEESRKKAAKHANRANDS